MVHYSLIDVLLQFRLNRILTADVSWMYRAIALVESDKDLHRFVWRTSLHDRVKTFAWPSIKQNYPIWKMSYGEVVLASDAAWPKLFWHPTFHLKTKMRSVFTLSSLKLILLSQLTDSSLSSDWGGSLRGWYILPGSLERLDMYLKSSCYRWIALWPWNWISEDKVGISHLFPRAEFQASLW